MQTKKLSDAAKHSRLNALLSPISMLGAHPTHWWKWNTKADRAMSCWQRREKASWEYSVAADARTDDLPNALVVFVE